MARHNTTVSASLSLWLRSEEYPPRPSVLFLVLLLGIALPVALLHALAPRSEGAGQLAPVTETLEEALAAVAVDGTVVVCTVSEPYVPFLNNWLISVVKQGRGRHRAVLVLAEDTATRDLVTARWPGHAVLLSSSPALVSSAAEKFGSQGFFNLTSRRPRHLLRILQLGYSVLYNDVDMVWVGDPFPYFRGEHDVWFADDTAAVKPAGHSSGLPPPGKKGRPYICSCLLFLRPTPGAKLLLRAWVQEMRQRPWSKQEKVNDQPAMNWALMKTEGKVDVYVLPQVAFPTGGLYFRNHTWREEQEGKQVVLHNNYIVGLDKKIKRFRRLGLWYLDTHADAAMSPLYPKGRGSK